MTGLGFSGLLKKTLHERGGHHQWFMFSVKLVHKTQLLLLDAQSTTSLCGNDFFKQKNKEAAIVCY